MRTLKARPSKIAMVLACLWAFPALAQSAAKPLELSFTDESNQTHTLAEFKGKYVLLNLWATWCPPCVAEMPALVTLKKDYAARNLTVIALSQDSTNEVVKTFYAGKHIEGMPLYRDGAMKAVSMVKGAGLPITLLLDANSVIIHRFTGLTDWNDAKVRAELDAAMKPAAATQ